MKKPVYYYISRALCKRKNAKERMMAESFENYRNIIITPEAAEQLADRIEQCVAEANIRYPRNKEFYSKRYIMNDDKTPSYLSVSDGTDNPVVYICLEPVTEIIDTPEDL